MRKSSPSRRKAAKLPTGERAVSARGPPQATRHFPVVGIGASAGGLDACRKLVAALPKGSGMAFILVQHLDPTHESMMVELLASHTVLAVRQASDGMAIEREHLYVIPPGAYLNISSGALHLSIPQARHGTRLPFDFFLRSLAQDCGARAICVILSGTGADGSLGLQAVKDVGGLVIAQDPDEAGYDGMPRNAIMTGMVDLVLPVVEIAGALAKRDRPMVPTRKHRASTAPEATLAWLTEFIELLRTRTTHDFKLYKRGTLQRRIERRMAMTAIETDDVGRYLDLLRSDAPELDLLAKDLLINVTSFFRDPKVFEVLSETIVPDLVLAQMPDRPLRIWIAGCSTGEETYSLAMLFREQITASNRNVKLQFFASDVDPDAIASAREGRYPETIEADVSPARLARFFSKEDHTYTVMPELRASVVFTVHDVLADPPFSRLDLVSCRNLLIYLGPEAQAKVMSRFHFALREGGALLLGNSETVGNDEGCFEVISKPARLYRRIGRTRPGEFGFSAGTGDAMRIPARQGQSQGPSRQLPIADICRRLVMEAYAPATVLINRRHECLYFVGPTDLYLHLAPGHPTHDLLSLAPQGLRTMLRSAIQQASQASPRIVVAGGQMTRNGEAVCFNIEVRSVLSEGEELLLVCFVDEPVHRQSQARPVEPRDVSRVAELEQELEATRTELRGAVRNLEISSEEQKAINEEALSVNEEYQSTNEELLTSKEELQSLNEELTALNSQLQETLERQRTSSNDLQNVLYSTDVATLFLDPDLNIRFFTPATRSLFNVIPGDIGRPLADLHSLSADGALTADARTVLQSRAPIEREIEAQSGVWFIRRILPYRTHDDNVKGVVITFADITERKHIAKALEAAKQQAELATVAKSKFLAAASHDLRQPLQTLVLLQGLLARTVEGEKAQKLVARFDETLGAMSSMLNALLDINKIAAGTVQAEKIAFPIDELFGRLRSEFAYHAQAKRVGFRVVSCGLHVYSDPRLLEQMLRNLLSNALKYTKRGKVLLGCRRRDGLVRIEVRDTGIGIAKQELQAIFEEYHQVDNAARERSRGLGLGLSIVQRLGGLLGHRIRVQSQPGSGSVFSIEVARPTRDTEPLLGPQQHGTDHGVAASASRNSTVLVVEDDPEMRDLLERFLRDEGYRTTTAPDGIAALELVEQDILQPDLILADYNLPKGLNGLQLTAKLRERTGRQIPVIILTGDISDDTLRTIASQDCVQLNKPVRLKELTDAIRRLLTSTQSVPDPRVTHAEPAGGTGSPVIFVVDDDDGVRAALRSVLEETGQAVEDFPSCEAFLAAFRPGRDACLLLDAYLPGMSGLALLQRLRAEGNRLPAIMITGDGDVPMAVQAMKTGALDFIEKPVGREELLASVQRALEQSRDSSKLSAWRNDAASQMADLTSRQRQIMDLVLAGHPSKNIAADLGISQRTVENHRASIMKRTGAKSLPALARLALAATSQDGDWPTAPAISP